MKEYENVCNKYVHRETKIIPFTSNGLFEQMANYVRTDAKIRLGIDLDKPLPIREPTEEEVYDVEHEEPSKDYINEIDF